MKIIEKPISIANTTLTLTNQRAVYWSAHETLILSDLHLGKGAHFRRHGIAIPAEISEEDLNQLSMLIRHYLPKRIIIAGDFLHAGNNAEVSRFQIWRDRFSQTSFSLVKGNHDRLSDVLLTDIGIDSSCEELYVDGIAFRHEYLSDDHHFQINGHVHPGVSLRLPTQKTIKFPCYVLTDKNLLLPAFSRFTGLDTKTASDNAQRYAFYEDAIFVV